MHKNRQEAIAFILHLFATRGAADYGGEPVSQLEHALQCAALAQAGGATQSLIAAALLHDLGHVLPAPDGGAEQLEHEYCALPLLTQLFGADVTEPIRLHVAAKRYLCAVQPGYFEALSPASKQSLMQQGGIFSADTAQQFMQLPFANDSIQLRYWDDQAKVRGKKTPELEHFLPILFALSKS